MHGLYLLWWVQERQVSPAAVAIILAAGDLAVTAMEVPTGWLADRYGHRASLIAGSALQIVGMLWCWFGRGILGLLTASLLVAFGDAFRSGADQALLYRSCHALDREEDFQQVEARTRAAALVALVFLLFLGGVIVSRWGFAGGWLIETILSVAGLVIAYAMVEPPAIDPKILSGTASADAAADRSRVPLSTFAALIIPASCLGGVAGAASFFAQTSSWANAERATILVGSVTLAEAAGALVARRATAGLRNQLLLILLGALSLAATLAYPSALIPATVALSLLLGIAEPLRATAIQSLSADHVRARAASIASACDKGVATMSLIVAGALQRK
jgi:MFS family permease